MAPPKGSRLRLIARMSHLPDNGHGQLSRVTRCLRAVGYDVESPHEEDQAHGIEPGTLLSSADWLIAIGRCLPKFAERDYAVLLPGWEPSEGAQCEVIACGRVGVPLLLFEEVPDGWALTPAVAKVGVDVIAVGDSNIVRGYD